MNDRQYLNEKQRRREAFAARLTKLMNAKGWHASELARQSGLQRASVSEYLNGRSFPNLSALAKLTGALGIGPDELTSDLRDEGLGQNDKVSAGMDLQLGAANSTRLRFDRVVSLSTAEAIIGLLKGENPHPDNRSPSDKS